MKLLQRKRHGTSPKSEGATTTRASTSASASPVLIVHAELTEKRKALQEAPGKLLELRGRVGEGAADHPLARPRSQRWRRHGRPSWPGDDAGL